MARTKQFDEQEALEKAMTLFWKKGYYDTSMQELVAQLGVNRASLYATYGDKETLFEKAFTHYQQRNSQIARSILAQSPRVRAGLKDLFALLIAQAVGDPEKKGCFVTNTTTELIPNEEKWLPLLDSNRRVFEDIFLQHLRRGVAQGEISPDLDLPGIAALLYALNNGLQVVAKVNPSQQDLMKIVETALRVLD